MYCIKPKTQVVRSADFRSSKTHCCSKIPRWLLVFFTVYSTLGIPTDASMPSEEAFRTRFRQPFWKSSVCGYVVWLVTRTSEDLHSDLLMSLNPSSRQHVRSPDSSKSPITKKGLQTKVFSANLPRIEGRGLAAERSREWRFVSCIRLSSVEYSALCAP